MIIFLYGSDPYRKNKKLAEIVERYKKTHENADMFRLDLSEEPDRLEELVDFLKQPSMFASSKIAVVKGVMDVDKKIWTETLKSYVETPEVFVVGTDKRDKLKKAFGFLAEDPVKSQRFEELSGAKLRKFIKKTAREEEEVKLGKGARRFLYSYASAHKNRGWLLVNEIKKLSLADFDEPISAEVVQRLIPWAPEGKMYSEARKMFKRAGPERKLKFLEELLLRDEEKSHIFNMLGYQTKGGKAEKLADLDILIKSGKLEYEEALTSFALSAD